MIVENLDGLRALRWHKSYANVGKSSELITMKART